MTLPLHLYGDFSPYSHKLYCSSHVDQDGVPFLAFLQFIMIDIYSFYFVLFSPFSFFSVPFFSLLPLTKCTHQFIFLRWVLVRTGYAFSMSFMSMEYDLQPLPFSNCILIGPLNSMMKQGPDAPLPAVLNSNTLVNMPCTAQPGNTVHSTHILCQYACTCSVLHLIPPLSIQT